MAGPGTTRGPRHGCPHPLPIPGSQGKEETPEPRSQVHFPSRTKPRPRGGTGRDELLGETEAEDQMWRRWATAFLWGPAPWPGGTAARGTFRLRPAGVSKEGSPPLPHTHSPNHRSGGTPSSLPVSGRKRSDSAFSSGPTSCRWRRRGAQSGGSRLRQWGLLGSWRGRTMTTPSVQQEHGRRVRARDAPDPWPAPLAPIPRPPGTRARP